MLHALTNDESLAVLDTLRLSVQREVNEGRRADPVIVAALAKISRDIEETRREVRELMESL